MLARPRKRYLKDTGPRVQERGYLKQLHIAHGFSLPLETVTQTLAILAKRRVGKSYTARRITEQLVAAKQQVVIIDPKGDWWGIRSSADGKAPGLPVTILGGGHGDIPLEVGSGELVAKLAVHERVSLLLDVSNFRKREVAVFMSDFLEAFYRLKAAEEYRSPVMLVVDEADAIAPQKPYAGEERMLGAIEDIVRRGGQRGIGCLLITQRSAVLNKNVLTQSECLVAMRTIAPQDLDAMNAWIDVHGTVEERKVLMASLPALPVGVAWFWSPGWPTEDGIFKRVHVAAIDTFDSGATPKPGEKRVEPKNLAQVDLEALRRQMAATIAKVEADDPRKLRQQIAALQKQVAARIIPDKVLPAAHTPAKEVAAERLKKEFDRGVHAERKRIAAEVVPQLKEAKRSLERILPVKIDVSVGGSGFKCERGAEIADAVSDVIQLLGKYGPLPEQAAAAPTPPYVVAVAVQSRSGVRTPPSQTYVPDGEFKLNRLRRAILIALAQHPNGVTRGQVLLHAGYRASGDVSVAFADLARRDFIYSTDDRDSAKLFITASGEQILGPYDPLPTGAELLARLLSDGKLSKVQKAMLKIISESGEPLSRGEIVQRSGYKPSGDVSVAFGRLVAYGYAVDVAGKLKLAEELV